MVGLMSFEQKDLFNQIDALEKLLEADGFEVEKVRSRFGYHNYYYSKEGCELVYCTLYHEKKNEVCYTVFDKDVYDKWFRGTGRVLTFESRNDGKTKIICSSYPFNNTDLHAIVAGAVGMDKSTYQADHISHNVLINTREMLRYCTTQQNNFNKECYSSCFEDVLCFKIRNKFAENEVKELKAKGYKLKGDYLYSPEFETESEMYGEIERIERMFMQDYRYNPVVDYSDTWYAYVLHKMLGLISKAELDAYNKDFMRRNQGNVARYYML